MIYFRCARAGLELKDGGTDFSPDIGTFCHNINGQDRPPTQRVECPEWMTFLF